jgi:serine/threonine protein kinase
MACWQIESADLKKQKARTHTKQEHSSIMECSNTNIDLLSSTALTSQEEALEIDLQSRSSSINVNKQQQRALVRELRPDNSYDIHNIDQKSSYSFKGFGSIDNISRPTIKFSPKKSQALSIGKQIGSGTSSQVFSLLNGNSTSVAAVKILNSKHLSDFLREKNALEALSEVPNILKLIHDISLVEESSAALTARGINIMHDSLFLFMEIYPKGDLYSLIERSDGGIPECTAINMARQLWTAVSAMHDLGIAHGDIKPENLLLADDGSLRIADFGFAESALKESNEVCGTKQYMAPEIAREVWHYSVIENGKCKKSCKTRKPYLPSVADVWSAGVTTFITLVGIPPFYKASKSCWFFCRALNGEWELFWDQHERNHKNRKPLSLEAKYFLQHALDPDPAQRATAQEMLLDPWLRGTHITKDGIIPDTLPLPGIIKGLASR